MSGVMRFIVAVGGGLALGVPAEAAFITTFPNSSTGAIGYNSGVPGGRALLGQTFAVGPAETLLTDFSLRVWASYVAGLPLEIGVIRWNPAASRAVGPAVFETAVTLPASPSLQSVTFSPNVVLAPNSTYLLYGASDPAAAGPPVGFPPTFRGVGFGTASSPANAYAGGQAWFTGGVGAAAGIAATNTWSSAGAFPGQDLTFSVNLARTPAPAGLVLVATALPVVAVGVRRRPA